MYCPFFHSVNLNGPEPTGLVGVRMGAKIPVAEDVLRRIGVSYPEKAHQHVGGGRSDSARVTVWSSGVFTSVTAAKVLGPRGWGDLWPRS